MLAAAGPLALGGCATTMQTAARLQLNDARIRAAQVRVLVPQTAASTTVRVQRLELVRAGRRIAYVVTVHNAGPRAIGDLPISIGYSTAGHKPVYLNAQANLSYFQAHLPAISAGRQLTWVYTARLALSKGARPFATIGATPEPPTGRVSVPTIAAAARVSGQMVTDNVLAVRLRNLSGIPQYQLSVYAFAERGGRVVGAGTTSVATLDGGSEQTVQVPLVGQADGARLTVEAPPTIFN